MAAGLVLCTASGAVAVAAPPLGTGLSGTDDREGHPATFPSLPLPPPVPTTMPVVRQPAHTPAHPRQQGENVEQNTSATDHPILKDEPVVATTPEPLPECPPEAPVRIDSTVCINQAALDLLNGGGTLSVDPDDGTAYYTPPEFDYLGGGYAFDPATEPCNPNVKVMLQEAAVAGSQVTRGMINTQLGYPWTDPIIAVNNPRDDGYGGSCTVALFTFDFLDILGTDGDHDLLQSLDDIVAIIDAIASFDPDGLFSAACDVFLGIFGEIQGHLIAAGDDDSPTPLQQFLTALSPGFVAPLQSLLDVAMSTSTTTATIPGVVTGSPLLVAFIPDLGYVYMARLQNGLAMVLHISQTPLAAGDAA